MTSPALPAATFKTLTTHKAKRTFAVRIEEVLTGPNAGKFTYRCVWVQKANCPAMTSKSNVFFTTEAEAERAALRLQTTADADAKATDAKEKAFLRSGPTYHAATR